MCLSVFTWSRPSGHIANSCLIIHFSLFLTQTNTKCIDLAKNCFDEDGLKSIRDSNYQDQRESLKAMKTMPKYRDVDIREDMCDRLVCLWASSKQMWKNAHVDIARTCATGWFVCLLACLLVSHKNAEVDVREDMCDRFVCFFVSPKYADVDISENMCNMFVCL